MPVQLQYSIEENADALTLLVSLRGIGRTQLDVYVSELFVKVTSTPYLLIVDLFDAVDEMKSVATVDNDELRVVMPKIRSGSWAQQTFKGTKEEILRRRNESIERTQEREKHAREEKARLKREAERHTVQRQIQVEQAERLAMEQRIEEEKRMFMRETALDNSDSSVRRDESDDEDKESNVQPQVNQPSQSDEETPADESMEAPRSEELNSDFFTESDVQPQPAYVPPVRQSNSVAVKFTPKIANVPARDSNDPNEVKKATGNKPKAEASTLEEKSAIWLKEKGDKFFTLGDFPSAIQAYSDALHLEPSNLRCLANRAAAHFRAGSVGFEYTDVPGEKLLSQQAFLKACVSDCSVGLSLTQNQQDIDKDLVVRFLVRRAAAHSLLENYESGIADYLSASKLAPEDATIKSDLERIFNFESQARTLANEQYRQGDFVAAIKLYSVAISIKPSVSSYSNRAASFLQANKDLDQAISDCTQGLYLLGESGNPLTKSRLHARRAAALCLVNNYEKGILIIRSSSDMRADNSSSSVIT
eukprot:TRINITY_DN8073_c0_g1_i5.p1 TRINITY_DN8073_c0_g1~~TRINITY_DN8073_c0_g1_i5.p1  ORF type:complete len:533 (-),score=99.17 TRINITY_DN8073_c0_g1_i5:330-1928(-)